MTEPDLIAVRAPRGRVHLRLGGQRGPWITACGRTFSGEQTLPWYSTAPEDRCRQCVRIMTIHRSMQ